MNNNEEISRENGKRQPSKWYALPFFIVLAVLTVVSFIIPLRPTQSMAEKRNLAEFPTFSVDALLSGDYFDDITLWFSDTYPARDNWISLSAAVEELHGIKDVVIYGDLVSQETVPSEYVADATQETRQTEPPTEETESVPEETEQTEETGETEATEETTMETLPIEETAPEGSVEEWGGVDAGEDAETYLGSVIQVGDTAFNYFGFSEYESNRFITTMTWIADDMAEKEDVNIVLCLVPTSVGVMVQAEYQEKIRCVDQEQVIDYLFSGIPDDIVEVDIFDTLVEHNDEYIYFRTDHHWTALGAYYAYQEICIALGMEPMALEDFEVLDMGVFRGSNYYKCKQSSKLQLDNVYAYSSGDDISMVITNGSNRFSWPMLTDMSKSSESSKYMTFLGGDHALCEITNNDLQNGKSCVIVKDSYGNAIAPFFAQNYQYVYVVDFREYFTMNMQKFVDQYDIDDVILMIQTGATQDSTYNNLIRTVLGVK